MAGGTDDTTEDGDETGAGVALAAGLALRDGRAELIAGLALAGVTVGPEVVGVAVAWVVVPVLDEPEPAAVGDVGLTQAKTSSVTTKMAIRTQVEVRIRWTRRISRSPPARKS
ncbi:MAG: hypothetical protein M3Z75_14410 [Actinomycetota bacterium]|nr:hypothetical protein [Actinomycetota bacterium]